MYQTKYPSRWNPLTPSIEILKENASSVFEGHQIATILEDVNSPIQMKYNQKIYDMVINKNHIDFDNIPESKGDIEAYSGTKTMRDTLQVIRGLDAFQKTNVLDYVNTIETAINNIKDLRDVFRKGFEAKSDYVMLEYNVYVYTCVEATTSLLYEFVDFVKRPGIDTYNIVMKNTKYRANLMYIESLQKFNNVNKNMLAEYRKFLLAMCEKEKDNFVGSSFAIGMAAITITAASVVPLTRELVYLFYNTKRKISDDLAYQAHLLEMNKAVVEASSALTTEKKKKVLEKQEKIKKKFIVWSEKLRVSDVKGRETTKRELNAENRTLTVDSIRKEVDNSSLSLL